MYFWNQEEREQNKERFKTAPFDARFPNTNQRKRCLVSYVDFWKCALKNQGEDAPECESLKFTYNEICPPVWIEEWNDQRESGRFPVRELNTATPKF